MKTLYYYLSAFIILMLCSCEEKKLEPISESLGKPGTVEVLEQKAIAGGVIVTYRIPNNEDILSVKAVYTLARGVSESVASYFENTLTIEGFNDMKEHEAKIYVINRAQVQSDPVTIKFTPLEASYLKVAKSMEIISDFGGARFSWNNPDQAPLIFEFFAADSIGKLQAMRVINSATSEMKYSLRGYKPEARKFGVVIRDHWDNTCDTIFPPETIVPLLEEKLNKKIMNVMQLSNDQNFANWEGMNHYIIDDDKETFGHSPNSSLPAPFTIDLGVKAKLSRFLFFNRNFNNSYYSWGNPKAFDVYVCFNTPSTSGNWDEWTKIGECIQTKPSGSPGTTMTDEDLAYAESGFEFEIDLALEPVRYIRFVIQSTWENTSFTHPCELDFFGVTVE
jgi:hypothetical protein